MRRLQNLAVILAEGIRELLGKELLQGLAGGLFVRHVKEGLKPSVDQEEVPCGVHNVNNGCRVIEYSAEPLLAFPQRFLDPFALHELPDLSAHIRHQSHQGFVGRPHVLTQELRDADYFAAASDREGVCGVQSERGRGRASPELVLLLHIADP